MFGYVRFYKPNLRVKEYDIYRGLYCGLCRALAREYGPPARIILRYDFVFLVLLRAAMSDAYADFKSKRCFVHPLRKTPCCRGYSDIFSYTAAVSVLSMYYKVRDDLYDAHFGGKITARLLLPYAAFLRKKAKRRFPDLDEMTAAAMARQAEVESMPNPGVDRAAEPSARLLSDLCAYGVADDPSRRVLARIGYCVGRWVYLVDAADDLPKDIKRGSFNPFAALYGMKHPDSAQIDAAREAADAMLKLTLEEATAALELLPTRRYQGILANILYEGLPAVQRGTLRTEVKTP